MRVEGRSPSMSRRPGRAPAGRPGRGQRGVALIVVVAVLAFLTAIAVTFFTMTRFELHNASSKRDTMLAEYQAQGALAIAMAFLNHDLAVHPTATSLDHAWRTYFDGSAFIGKEWMYDGMTLPPEALYALTDGTVVTGKYIPRIFQGDLAGITYDQLYIPRFQGGTPGVDTQNFSNPFVVPQNYDGFVSRADVVDLWADVDLDGDGLKDAIWLPMPMERALDTDGIDNDLDGLIDEGPNMATDEIDNDGDGAVDEPDEDPSYGWLNDNIDNDLDGWIDEGPNMGSDGKDNDNDGAVDEADENPAYGLWLTDAADNDGDGLIDELDEAIDPSGYETMAYEGEVGIFVYWGGNDGLDNDNDGVVDDPDEARAFLTAPIFYDSDLTNTDPDQTFLPSFTVMYDEGRLREFAQLDPGLSSAAIASAMNIDQGMDVDALDNDYSLVTNEYGYFTYGLPVYAAPATYPYANWVPAEYWALGWFPALTADQRQEVAELRRGAFNELDVQRYWPGLYDPLVRITATGEPVCDVVGRFAVHIKDEASKVDLNATGAYTRDDYWGWDDGDEVWDWPNTTRQPVMRAVAAGSTPFEYEMRLVDGATTSIGLAHSNHLWSLRTGAPGGIGLGSVAGFSQVDPLDPADSPSDMLDLDIGLPGYGWADDNGNALWLSMDGIDNDGDGLIDEGLNPLYPELLGRTLEGVDEPEELQLHSPLRNLAAETDDADNDVDGALNEIGELGDRLFRTFDQIELVDGMDAGYINQLGGRLTVHNAGNNDRYRYFSVDGYELYNDLDGDLVRDPFSENAWPRIAGLKLDYNYASAAQIARYLREEWGYVHYPFGDPAADPFAAFALGLWQGSVDIVESVPPVAFLGGAATAFPRDNALHADQIAVNVKDGGDGDNARTELTSTVADAWWTNLTGLTERAITYTSAGTESIRINEVMVRPVRRMEAETQVGVVGYDPNAFNSYGIDDFDVSYALLTDSFAPPLAAQWVNAGAGYLGDREVLRTTEPTFLDAALTIWPNVIQYRFGPSPQLPPGRYYLTVNTTDENGTPALYSYAAAAPLVPDGGDDTDQLDFITKYAAPGAGDTDILTDVLNFYANDPLGALGLVDDLFGIVQDPRVGYANMDLPDADRAGNESGWLFLPTTSAPIAALPGGLPAYELAFGAIGDYGTDSAYAVEIPDYANPGDPQEYLYVAVRSGMASTRPLPLNFFDFSQEPDHEWVEVANVAQSGEAVDLSGWELTVGVPGSVGGARQMTVPADTYIAPGGSLLLGVNKYDHWDPNDDFYRNPADATTPLVYHNGIGLARGSMPTDASFGSWYDWFENVSAPPIPDIDLAIHLGTPDVFGSSVFRRPRESEDATEARLDFEDYNGDGVRDATLAVDTNDDGVLDATWDEAIQSTVDPLGPPRTGKAWDRIVELVVTDLQVDQGLDGLSYWVLRGGLFPNYPDHDSIDNDADSGAFYVDDVSTPGADLDGALELDGVDNDGDGLVDEPNEGIDEGAGWGATAPGGFSDAELTFTYDDGGGSPFPDIDPGTDPYLGSAAEPPRWKEFVERRLYPGDNIVVTLYDGDPAYGRIVDRVTYNERDVINRAIDDKVSTAAWGVPPLDAAFATFWPDNTMGVDFYRALERKHPLYTGDRFGTKNRWEATDGNYDDWDSGQDRFESDGTTAWVGVAPLVFGHTFSGTPLRMNRFERYANNPEEMMTGYGTPEIDSLLASAGWLCQRARVPNRGYTSPGSVAALPRMTLLLEFDDGPFEIETVTRAMMAVDPELTTVSNTETRDFHALVSGGAMDPVVLTCGQAAFYPLYPSAGDVAAGDVQWDIVNAVVPRVWAPVFLFPLSAGEETPGSVVTIGGFPEPERYAAFRQLGTAYPLEMNFLFNGPVLPPTISLELAAPNHDLRQRWPLDRRAMMYMTANPADFDMAVYDNRRRVLAAAGADDLASEALFVWDGTAGLEDGEYDVYVVTAEPLGSLLDSNDAARAYDNEMLLIDQDGDGDNREPGEFGYEFVATAMGPAPDELPVDLEFFTDNAFRDRRCWADGVNVDTGYDYPGAAPAADGLPQPDEMNTLDDGDPTTPACVESLGLMMAAVPDTSGVIHYGTVKVDNNYLALRIRNWAAPGRLNRFSRVVLTPSNRTSGRININTAETMKFRPDDGVWRYFFNPLQGLPGILGAWSALDPAMLVRPFAENNHISNENDDLDNTNNAGVSVDQYNDMFGRAEGFAGYYFDARDNRAADVGTVNDVMMARQEECEHEDGRYYEYVSDMYYALIAAGGRPVLSGAAGLEPDFSTLSAWEQGQILFNENATRFSALANVVTTRSDVFEITVIAQAGYPVDENQDGVANWRDDIEFKVNAENKLRTVYER